MDHLCENRVVAITGAGRGLGRAYAIAYASLGAMVVVNDVGADVSGSGHSQSVAQAVADEIVAADGQAVADSHDITTSEGADGLLHTALDQYGRLDVLVCNAGSYRVEWLWDTTPEHWDGLMQVHLRGLFCPASAAIQHWRERAASEKVDARLICITSQSGLFGAPATAAYDTAKAGVAGFVIVAAKELERFGITVNGVAPRANTRMTEVARETRALLDAPPAGDGTKGESPPTAIRQAVPEDVAPFVAWLGSTESASVTGRIFTVTAGRITLVESWSNGPSATTDGRFDANAIAPVVADLLKGGDPPNA